MAAEYGYWTATPLVDGRVLVVGDSPNAGARAVAELYDPSSGEWTATGRMATAGSPATATLLPDGKVLVLGVHDDDGLATAELYEPSSGEWTATGRIATARVGFAATLLPDGKVLVAGGYNGGEGDYAALSAAELYDPSSGEWTTTGGMAEGRDGPTAMLLPDGRVLVVGGLASVGSDPGAILASAELYDPSSGKWTATGSMATARVGFGATLLADGRVLVAGGIDRAVYIDQLATAELYDPSSGKWTATGSMAEGRRPTATLLLDGKVLVVGDDHTRSAELYDPRSGRWTATTSTLVARSGTATLLLDGRVLVVGGDRSAEVFDPKGGLSSP